MAMKELAPKSDHANRSRPWFRTVLGIACAVVVFCLVIAGLRLATVWSLYAYLLHFIVEETGLDLRWARPLVLAIMAIVAVVPWWSLLLPWRSGRRRRALLMGLLMAGLSAGLSLVTENVFFDSYGRPARFYAVVPGGYRLSDAPGVDRQYGVVFKAMTPVAARQVLAWERAGRSPRMQPTPCTPAFDLYSGEPTCWYDRTHDGQMRFSPVPGFDPGTGAPLDAVTQVVIEQFESAVRRDLQRQHIIGSAEFRNIRVVFSDPPRYGSFGVDGTEEVAGRLEAGMQLGGEVLLPKLPPQLPSPETPDGLIALAVQQATGLMPRERVLFRITDDIQMNGSIVLPERSVAEGTVIVWAAPDVDHEIRAGITFSRIWIRGRARPFAFRAHLMGVNKLLFTGAISAVCLDEPFSTPLQKHVKVSARNR